MVSVLVPLADGCEELEAVTLIDLLRRAGVEVVTASLDDRPVEASRGTRLLADTSFDRVAQRDFDMILLPGGAPGARRLAADMRLRERLRAQADAGGWTAAICAAPSVLAAAGLLEGRRATSFPGWLDDYEGIERVDEAVVIDGRIATSRGPGTAMDFTLELIARLCGEPAAREVEAALQRPPAHRRYAD